MATLPIETLALAAGPGLRFVDAWSGQPVSDGLACTLRRKRDGKPLAREAVTASGVHRWPGLRAPWTATSPSPPHAALAEVLVEDTLDRFVALRLDWPPAPDTPGGLLATVTLPSAPGRLAPPGAATVAGLLATEDGRSVAWARLQVTDAAARTTEGMSDRAGRFALHLPFPRPERRPAASPPASPPAGPGARPVALATLRVFHDPALAAEAGADAPLARAWLAQPEVRALGGLDPLETLGPIALEPGQPAVPRTGGLPPDHSELRLAPL